MMWIRFPSWRRGGEAWSRCRGFTLIELLVSISVIVVFVGLLAVAVSARGGPRDARTRLIFQTLLAVADEYTVLTRGGEINRKDKTEDSAVANDATFFWNRTSEWTCTKGCPSEKGFPDDSSERFVVGAMQHLVTTDLILGLSASDVLVDIDGIDGKGDGFFELRDAWGQHIEYCDSSEDCGTMGNNSPEIELDKHSSLFFCSAGRDGEFGTDDDLYSFDFE